MKRSNHKVWLRVGCTEEERDKIKSSAARLHMSIGDYILMILKKELEENVDEESTKKVPQRKLSIERGEGPVAHNALG